MKEIKEDTKFSKLLSLSEWREKIEMAGVSTIVTKKDCFNPDFQVAGSYCNDVKRKKKH